VALIGSTRGQPPELIRAMSSVPGPAQAACAADVLRFIERGTSC
jgi:hypothetical protein